VSQLFYEKPRGGQRYFRCSVCELIFLDPERHLAAPAEKARYDLHTDDYPEAHLKFLAPAFDGVQAEFSVMAERARLRGLDFGSGPHPTLVKALVACGFTVASYDPFYANEPDRLRERYDFVTCTEVVEHFHEPQKSWRQLFALLKDEGHLFVMTEFYPPAAQFPAWYYHGDPTHVCFYGDGTMDWLARLYRASWIRLSPRCVRFSVSVARLNF
jgi:hypothetical protein